MNSTELYGRPRSHTKGWSWRSTDLFKSEDDAVRWLTRWRIVDDGVPGAGASNAPRRDRRATDNS